MAPGASGPAAGRCAAHNVEHGAVNAKPVGGFSDIDRLVFARLYRLAPEVLDALNILSDPVSLERPAVTPATPLARFAPSHIPARAHKRVHGLPRVTDSPYLGGRPAPAQTEPDGEFCGLGAGGLMPWWQCAVTPPSLSQQHSGHCLVRGAL
jgi:hypothetical protein